MGQPKSWIISISGFGLGLILGYIAYQLGGIGGGDVKVFAVLGIVLKLSQIIWLVWISLLIGIFYYLVRNRLCWSRKGVIPLGVCIMLAYLFLIYSNLS